MTTKASQITSLMVVYSTVYSDADQRNHQSSTSQAFVWGNHRDRWIPRTKGQLRRKCFHLMTSSWKYGTDTWRVMEYFFFIIIYMFLKQSLRGDYIMNLSWGCDNIINRQKCWLWILTSALLQFTYWSLSDWNEILEEFRSYCID